MPGHKGRIDWTDFEEDKVARATLDILRAEHVKMPIDDPWKRNGPLLAAVRKAQVVLPENRRRPIANRDTVAGISPLFVKLEILKPEDSPAKSSGVKKEDPTERRLNQIADERDAAMSLATELQEKLSSANAEIRALKVEVAKTPRERDVLVNFFGDIMYAAQAKSRAVNKPDVEVTPPPPDPERRAQQVVVAEERRKIEASQGSTVRLPKVLIAGGIQQERLNRLAAHFDGKIRFIFWRDESYDVLADRAKGADMTYALMGAIDHGAVGKIMNSTRFFQRVQTYSDEHLKNLISNWLAKEWPQNG